MPQMLVTCVLFVHCNNEDYADVDDDDDDDNDDADDDDDDDDDEEDYDDKEGPDKEGGRPLCVSLLPVSC